MTPQQRFYEFFRYVATSPEGQSLAVAQIVAKFVNEEPDYIVVDATQRPSETEAFAVYFNSGPKPDVTFTATVAVYESVLRGELSVIMAMTTGKIKSRGSIAKAMRMLPLFEKCIPLYKRLFNDED